MLETLWTVVPVFFLVLGLVHGLATLYCVSSGAAVSGAGTVSGVVGHQW